MPHTEAVARLLLATALTLVPVAADEAGGQPAKTTNDDTYQFAARPTQQSVTLVEREGALTLDWPQPSGRWDTALLGIRIAADAAAEAPRVLISAGPGKGI